MSRSVPALALALLVGAGGCVRGVGTPQDPRIEALELRGVRSVDRDDLASKLANHGPLDRPGVAGVLVKDRQRLDPDALPADRRRVEAYYRERGWYEARVTDVEVVPAGAGLVKVVFHVDEGRPVHVAKVTVNGLDAAPEARARLEHLPIAPGQVFDEAAYDAARAAILNALLSTGWANAEVSQSAVVLPETSTAEVTYDARPGRRFRFGPIFVAGSASVAPTRIREQVLGALAPGDWWDESRLAVAQQRVFELSVFGGVRVTRGTPDAARGTIPVVVAVREAPFRTLRAGPGLGFQLNRWEVHALFGWQHRNFLGDLRHVSTDVRVGFAWVPNPWSWTKRGPVALVGAELRQPGALTRYVDTGARLEVERGVLETYDFWAERLKLSLPLRIAPRWTLVPSYNLEVYELSNFTTLTMDNMGLPILVGNQPVLSNCRVNGVCLLTYLEQRIAWDGRDNPLETRVGVYAAVSIQEATRAAGYGYRYLRLVPELRGYHPLGRRTVVAARARVGALVPLGESGPPPIVARFMAGGPLSMRGYSTGRLSPMLQDSGTGKWVPVGGNGQVDGSLELRFALGGSLGMVLFVDAGGVSSASARPTEYQKALDPTRLQWATGLGFRYHTPFGPLRADLGARLPERFTGPFRTWFPPVPFTSPEHREAILALQIALGEAF